MRIFFDTEFTGLHKGTTLISLGMVSENGKRFYAEFTDYDKSQADPWVQENVINNLEYTKWTPGIVNFPEPFIVKGDSGLIKRALTDSWFLNFDKVEFWNDCLSYDWVLLSELLGGIEGVSPDDNYYYPYSLCSLDTIMGTTDEDYKIMRNPDDGKGHNSLYDAIKIKECFDKTMKLR